MSKRVLFITRRYPPCIGGIETHCHELFNRLNKSSMINVRLVALRHKSLLHLLWFLPSTLIRTFALIATRQIDVIYFADGVTCSLATIVRPFTRIHFTATIYGLELTYKNKFARTLMLKGIDCCDKIAVISRNTYEAAIKAGLDKNKIDIIYLGIKPLELTKEKSEATKVTFEKEHELKFGRDKILLNFGRLIPRKGVAAFLENGMSLLEKDIKLIIGGGGVDFDRVKSIIERNSLSDRVLLLPFPSDEVIAMLRTNSDLFLFPNVQTECDIEGFGMTQLESMYSGTPVVAFAVDALVESVREGGYLIEPNDYKAFVEQIHNYYLMTEENRATKIKEAQDYVRREYSWDITSKRYIKLFYNENL